LSEREDADIYEHYRQQKEKHEDNAKEAQMKIDTEELNPQMPRFQDYFKQQSNDTHPFEHIAREKVDLEDGHAE